MPELIPPEFAEFVQNELASGHYHSAEEVVAEGLRAAARAQVVRASQGD